MRGAFVLLSIVLACGVVLALVRCSGPSDRIVYDRPNVLLITLDTCRVDRMSVYGAKRKTTPNLERFAQDAVRFDSCWSQSSFTPPSHASILTSRYVSSHGVKWWNYQLDESAITLAEAFHAKGFTTACFSPLALASGNNLKQGFEHVVELTDGGTGRFRRQLDAVAELFVAPGSAIRESFQSWVTTATAATAERRPFFAWVHFYDAHRPFAANAPEREFCADKTTRFGNHLTQDYQLKPRDRTARKIGPAEAAGLVDRYDSGLLGLDREVGALLDHLRAIGALDHTIVVITADHGEAFAEWDPEWFTHDPFLYDAVTHIPLLVRFPDRRFAAQKIAPIVESIDIAPTLLDYCGYAAEQGMQGASLRPAIEDGRAVKDFALSERQGRDHDVREPDKKFSAADVGMRRSLRGNDLRLVVEGESEEFRLFERDTEPFERTDVFGAGTERARSLRSGFERTMKVVRALSPNSNVSAPTSEQQEFMNQQGYTSGGAAPPATAPANDPKSSDDGK